ncbi:SIR2 family protein [Patescibacteria group bacterium]|nr:SIR2 family protein [Patescibacteria group bacterium]
MTKIDVIREIRELKNHLSYSKNIGFFFGAGTSCALGIPDIAALTKEVEANLKDGEAKTFRTIKDDLSTQIHGRDVNVEDILNQSRSIRELTKESETKTYQGVCGKDAAMVDDKICKAIYQIITEKESSVSHTSTNRFFAWYNLLNRDFTKEVFTTNYDLVLEKALESSEIPYFDGFVGSFEPFFWQESVDHRAQHGDLTKNWIRVWKIHGSLSWFWKYSETTKSDRIIRIGNIGSAADINNQLVIYPSKDKYDSSRKQPFITYFDRMRDYLLSGELLFVFTGYSFSDQHINEIVFNCMRQNNRLFVIVFFYKDDDVENLYKSCSAYLNLHVFGPTKAIINGELGEWHFNKDAVTLNENTTTYWNDEKSHLTLGDFNALVKFLVASSGKQDSVNSGTT